MDAVALILIPAMAMLLGTGVYLHQRSRPGPGGPPGPTSRPGGGSRIRIVDTTTSSGRVRPSRSYDDGRVHVKRGGTEGCQVCGETIAPGEAYTRCTAGHPHHRACTIFADHCALPNCSARFS